MNNEVWVLGATGRTGRAVAAQLHEAGVPLVLVGRNRERLEAVATELGGTPRLLVDTLDSVLAKLASDAPGVVVNTIGPFTTTASLLTRACPAGTHYVDISNEFPSAELVLALDRQATAARQTFVTGAGFGALATESVLLHLCEGQPTPTRVRVDALASVATEPGVIGSALAASIVESVALGGRQIRHGRLVRSRLAADPAHLTTPDGEAVGTASGANAELLAAWRASNADTVIAASTMVPTSAIARLLLPAVSAILRVPAIGGFAVNRAARIRMSAKDRPRPSSWAHARAEWSSGVVREAWLRAGDGMDFTVAAMAEVTRRLLRGEGQPGAYTPGSLFGPELAVAAGGEFIADPVRTSLDRG